MMRGLGDNRGSLEIGVDTGSCCSALDLREIMFGVLFMLQSCGLLALFPQALNPKSQTLNPTARLVERVPGPLFTALSFEFLLLWFSHLRVLRVYGSGLGCYVISL